MIKTAIRSEWIKFFSYQWCAFGAIGTVVIAPFILSISGVGNGQIVTANSLIDAGLRNLFLSQAGVVIIAASFLGQEFSNAYLRTTLLTIPSRIKLVMSKMIVLTLIVLGIAILSSIICLGVVSVQYHMTLSVYLIINFMTKVMLAFLSWLLLTWLTLSLTIITKSQIIPIAIMFSLILGFSQLLFAITKFAKYLPDLATMNLFFSIKMPALLGIYQGLLVQLIWCIVFFIIALLLIQHRDVH
ncbi:ABC transporter permease [Pseudolactococcus plantarum]|uniref:ABC transporter permease n=1 Tax=Pseudolactococcus plantarum TaxID=1365 RepID=A0A2A5RYG9_9LACT|nr:ABC transporter permease [Lactococcus plantarum]PCS06244.1 hypothetical protein RU87_GL001765 [Lactococcus plantarum]HCN74758.1 ABC transporter permease [Lactococcus sp.]